MGRGMRLDRPQHASRPFRVHDIAPDFELVDAWALPARGTRAEFADLCAIFSNLDPAADAGPTPSRVLFAVRSWLGERFGWDEEPNTLPIPGATETTLRDRLPPDLEAEAGETAGRLPFRPIFRTDDEWAAELSNATVHAILHLAWVEQEDNSHRGQLGVYVKHRGRIGRPYMAAIAPFRHHVVYPALLRRIDRAWRARARRQGVVAVIHADGAFLWIKRGPGVVMPGYWSPPTGSVEPGETAEQAVVREMREELGIAVRPVRRVWECPTETGNYLLDWWLTEIESGTAHIASDEIADVRWVTPSEIHELAPTFSAHLEFVDDVWPTIDPDGRGNRS